MYKINGLVRLRQKCVALGAEILYKRMAINHSEYYRIVRNKEHIWISDAVFISLVYILIFSALDKLVH